MSFIDDWKEWSTTKKVLSIVAVCCIGIIVAGALIGGFSPDKNTSTITNNANDVTSNDDSNTSDADKVFTEGTYKVGSDLPAGEYKFTQTSEFGGYVERSSDSSMKLESIISNEATSEKGATVYVTVKEGEYLKIQGGELVEA
ncbi:hypothetical protein [Methanobrevibacter olleyae]|uniref:Uncharacterized protein n=1 Tax=Methanobrevibacter olleyae TaxID=294671 RepID=A0A126R3Q2_METOL|nr:hypothetical protein [Methanobrevibacter olleyae]AMK16285.1 hypothetical protein YLM1_1730 [Methanobrevibacter olleyae]